MIKAIEPLGKHDRAAFSCGVTALDDWFRLRAGQDEKRNARVFVAIDDQLGIVGFYSLSSFTLAVADLPPEQAKRLLRYDIVPFPGRPLRLFMPRPKRLRLFPARFLDSRPLAQRRRANDAEPISVSGTFFCDNSLAVHHPAAEPRRHDVSSYDQRHENQREQHVSQSNPLF
jgi:hypothetical protein